MIQEARQKRKSDEIRFSIEKLFNAEVTICGYRDVEAVIKKLLTERQLQIFWRTCFEHFLDLKDS